MSKFKYIFTLVFSTIIGIVIIGSWITINEIKKQEKKSIKVYLETILKSTHQGIDSWAEKHESTSKVWAKEVLPIAQKLIKLRPDSEELLNSPLQSELRELLNPLYREGDYEGFFIIGPENINMASSRDINIGIPNILLEQEGILERMWNGKTVLSLPVKTDVPLPTEKGKLDNSRATMFIGTPLKDNSGKVIGVFTLRINPTRYFTKIFEEGRIGESGETYGVDIEGRMISNTRFTNQLHKIGLIGPDESGILKIRISDPGVNLVSGGKLLLPPDSLPLTIMAKSLTKRESGFDLDGYRDYRGVPVIGVWKWNDKFDFGTTTEMDFDEAFKGFHTIRSTIISLSLLIIGLIIAIWIN